jgi:phosphatidylserine decarboxylase
MINRKSIIVPEGLPFVFITGFFSLIAVLLSYSKTAIICLTATAFVAWFFRNPRRHATGEESLVISPADGKIIKI